MPLQAAIISLGESVGHTMLKTLISGFNSG
jgi:hypothetical protein